MTKRKHLRSPENATRICELLAEGHTLRQVAGELGLQTETGIVAWGNDEGDPAFRERYARAMERRWERMADELVEISDSDCTVDGKPDNALVQQARLRVDTRKWMLSKMVPRRYGDRITAELTSDPDAPLIQRIELIAVDPPRRREELPAPDGGDAVTVRPLRVLPSR